MAARNFSICLAAILSEEGGFADNPGDPGGATNMGITRATLATWRGQAVSREDVMMLERPELERIYREKFWAAISADDVSDGLDLALFDDAVNSGPRQAIRDLQRALQVTEDGLCGPVTRAAMEACAPADLIVALGAARLARLKGLSHFSLFGRGWARRIQRIERQAKALAKELAKELAKVSRGRGPAPQVARGATTHKETAHMAESNNPTNDTKPFWASQTIWSSIAVIGSSVTGALLAWKGNDIAGFGAALTALLGASMPLSGAYGRRRLSPERGFAVGAPRR